jgi:integrase
VRRTAAGRDDWYGKWYANGRQVKRRLGPKRGPDGRGLDKRGAERKLQEAAQEATPPPDSRISVEEAGRRLIEQREALGRKPATIEAYDSLLRIHLAPFFAGRSLGAVTPDDLEAFVRAKAAEGKSAKTTRNALALLHSIYEYGLRKGWVTRNPAKLVDKPRDTAEPDIRFLEPEEVDAVIQAELNIGDVLAPTLGLMYRTAALTGLRQGELIALRWRDVDWPAGRLRVRRSYVRGEFSSPKSRRGTRSVPLHDELAGELERHSRGSPFQADDDLVFPHPRLGSPLDRTKVRKRFKDAVKAAKVRQVRFHDLRHTFGTRMAGVGVPMRTLQEWMGHCDFKTTLIYADYSPSAREHEWVEAAFARGTEHTAAEQADPAVSTPKGDAVAI